MSEQVEMYAQDAADAIAQRDELRAVVAVALADPLRVEDWDEGVYQCRFCEARFEAHWWPDHHYTGTHNPDCPVLRKDELLGRG